MTTTAVLEPGTRLDDRYEVVRLLGRGGMAAVYEVRHLGLKSTHALKVLDPALANDSDLRNRFLAEGQIQAQLRHPHVVAVTEIVTNPVAGLVMELVSGADLGSFVRDRPELSLAERAGLLVPVLDAVGFAHEHGIVHRDLKPENILVAIDRRGRPQPKVTDFGIAKVLDDAGVVTGKRKTATRLTAGTYLYMSPEAITRGSEVDARSDVFALGAILYELVTGRPAFEGQSDFQTMKKIVEGTYSPPDRHVGGLPPALGAVIRRSLEVDPSRRFSSCNAFEAALDEALSKLAPQPRDGPDDADLPPRIAIPEPRRLGERPPPPGGPPASNPGVAAAVSPPAPVRPVAAERWKAVRIAATGLAVAAAFHAKFYEAGSPFTLMGPLIATAAVAAFVLPRRLALPLALLLPLGAPFASGAVLLSLPPEILVGPSFGLSAELLAIAWFLGRAPIDTGGRSFQWLFVTLVPIFVLNGAVSSLPVYGDFAFAFLATPLAVLSLNRRFASTRSP